MRFFSIIDVRHTAQSGNLQRRYFTIESSKRSSICYGYDGVMIDNFGVTGGKRIEGKIVNQLSPSTFSVKTAYGIITKRHANQIVNPLRRSTRIANKSKQRV